MNHDHEYGALGEGPEQELASYCGGVVTTRGCHGR